MQAGCRGFPKSQVLMMPCRRPRLTVRRMEGWSGFLRVLALAGVAVVLAVPAGAEGHVWRGQYACSHYDFYSGTVSPRGTLRIVDGDTYRANGSGPRRYHLSVKPSGVHVLSFKTGPYRDYYGRIKRPSHNVITLWEKGSGHFLWQCDH